MSIINPADILRMRADLRDRFRSDYVRATVDRQFSMINSSIDVDTENVEIGMGIAISLEHARTYRIEQQMTEVIEARAAEMDRDRKFPEPPTAHGFVVFEEPFVMYDIQNRREVVHAMTWTPMNMGFKSGDPDTTGVLITTWNDTYREGDEVFRDVQIGYTEFAKAMGRWSMHSAVPLMPIMKVGPRFYKTNDKDQEMITNEGFVGKINSQTRNLTREIAVLFDMLSERVPATKRENAELSRTEKKQAKREGLEPEVILVTLRPEFDPTHHDYRSGTGRTQKTRSTLGDPTNPSSIAYYRTIHRGTPRERKVPVRAHYRGPDDGPAPTPKVYNLGR